MLKAKNAVTLFSDILHRLPLLVFHIFPCGFKLLPYILFSLQSELRLFEGVLISLILECRLTWWTVFLPFITFMSSQAPLTFHPP